MQILCSSSAQVHQSTIAAERLELCIKILSNFDHVIGVWSLKSDVI